MERKKVRVLLRLSIGCMGGRFMLPGEIVGGVALAKEPPLALVALDRPLSADVLCFIRSAAAGADLTHLRLRACPPSPEVESRLGLLVDVYLRVKRKASASRVAPSHLRSLGRHACFTEAQARQYLATVAGPLAALIDRTGEPRTRR